MRRLITPTWHVNSLYSLTASDLSNHQIEGVICDLDNTLIDWNEVDATERMINWIHQLEGAGIQVYLLSNNTNERLEQAIGGHPFSYHANAIKPLPHGYHRVLKEMKIDKEKVVAIGDQVMTDIIGANLQGMRSILVKPTAPNDNIYTWLNRRIERLALKWVGIERNTDWGDQLD